MDLEKEADRLWSQIVRRKNGGKCILPGCKRRQVDPHHIIPRARGKILRWDIDNGVPVCREHHNWLQDTSEGLEWMINNLPEYQSLLQKSRSIWKGDIRKVVEGLRKEIDLTTGNNNCYD